MKISLVQCLSAMLLGGVTAFIPAVRAGTTIDPANHYAYGANIGWIDWRGDTNNGAVIGSNYCSGFIYSANVGWIKLGAGSPLNGTSYQNNSAADFGVNVDIIGNLTGYAYGANIGWIAFEAKGAPKVNLSTGRLSGYAYSANCGWISLSNSVALVQTSTSQLGTGPTSQFLGVSIQPGGSCFMYGTGVPNFTYTVLANTNLATTNWIPIGTATAGGFGTLQFIDSSASQFKQRFYRFSYP